MHPDWLIPDWPAPPRVRAVFSTRAGGVSSGVYDSMNLGDHVGDAPEAVLANRDRLARALGARPVFMRQVHGYGMLGLSSQTRDGLVADGAWALTPDLACTVMVADCLPILLTHDTLSVVAALHAGWRGLAGTASGAAGTQVQGIVESGLAAMGQALGCSVADLAPGLMAWLGPCIGPRAFEVGQEVRAAFVAADRAAGMHFAAGAPGKYWADLPALARSRLHASGVSRVYGNDGGAPWCTVGHSAFFSHRRCSGRPGAAAGQTGGRMAACIWLT